MSSCQKPRPTAPATGWGIAAIVGAVALGVIVTPPARAQGAEKILKAMSDYVTSQKSVSISFDTDIEVMTSDLQKIQFTSSGQALLSRPDKVRINRAGGYADVELVFDGKTASVLGRNINAFAQVDSPGTVDQLVDKIRDQFNVQMSGADLVAVAPA